MDKSVQNELDTLKKKLDKIQAGNRARAKKFQAKVKASDKRMISAILEAEHYEILCQQRDASIQAETPESFGNILGKALSFYVRYNAIANDSEYIIANDQTVKPEPKTIDKEKVVENLPKAISEPKPIEDPISVIDTDTSQDLKEILLNLEPGTWKEKAKRLNDMSILTASGKTWTANNLRMAVKNLNDK